MGLSGGLKSYEVRLEGGQSGKSSPIRLSELLAEETDPPDLGMGWGGRGGVGMRMGASRGGAGENGWGGGGER